MHKQYYINDIELGCLIDAIKIRYCIDISDCDKAYFKLGIERHDRSCTLLNVWARIMSDREYIKVYIVYGKSKLFWNLDGYLINKFSKTVPDLGRAIKENNHAASKILLHKTICNKISILEIPATDTTPYIYLNKYRNKFEISGRSTIIKCDDLYLPVINWLELYCDSPNSRTDFYFKLEDIDICSAKNLLNILKILEQIKDKDKIVNIYWQYSDVDIHEVGTQYQNMINAKINIICVD